MTYAAYDILEDWFSLSLIYSHKDRQFWPFMGKYTLLFGSSTLHHSNKKCFHFNSVSQPTKVKAHTSCHSVKFDAYNNTFKTKITGKKIYFTSETKAGLSKQIGTKEVTPS